MQPSILPGAPVAGRYLTFSCQPGADASSAIRAIEAINIDEGIVIGLGAPLVSLIDGKVSGLRPFPAMSGPGLEVPSTQHALWVWLRGDDHGELVNRSIALSDSLAATFRLEQSIGAFKHGNEDLGRDLTGYEDGTENPAGDAAAKAALAGDGSSFVAVQQWVHDLRNFRARSQQERDHIIGRRLSDNAEIKDAPESAHVKRAEQESFEPAAFVLRRSMPFASQSGEGLMFVAFGKSLDAFEVQMRRMAGEEDGIADALFTFSRPVSGGYYWCPPCRDGRLDLTAVQG